MISETSWLGELVPTSRALAGAESPAEAFKLLMVAARSLAPRSAVFLVRQGEILGWNAAGYPPEVCQQLRAYRSRLESGWLGSLASDARQGMLGRLPSAGNDPDFGQAPSSEATATAVRVKGKPIAFLLAERHAREEPWSPEGLALLVTVAQLRLELNLALRKAETSRSGAGVAPPAAGDPARPARVEPPRPEPPPARQATAVAPLAEASGSPALDAARRYARLVATDIRLYNEDAVAKGQVHRDLASRLAEQLIRGRETFLQRHGTLGPEALDLLREAYVQVLAGGDAELLPESVLH